MKGRKPQSVGSANRDFKRNAGVHVKNVSAPKRGGYRL